MQLPPGPLYLLRTFPSFAIPSTIVYASLTLAKEHLSLVIPVWVAVFTALLARPAILIFNRYYSRFADNRHAAANNAVVAPCVRGSAFSIINKMSNSFKHNYPADSLLRWVQEYGNTYQLRLLTDNRIVTVEPHHVKAILATQFDAFEKGTMAHIQFMSLLGEGVFNADGEMWKFHRAMTRPFFTRERISDFDIYDKNCVTTLQLARTRLAEGYPVEFQDLVARFTLDSATEFLFGHDVGSLSADIFYPKSAAHLNKPSFYNHPSTIFVKAFSEGQERTAARSPLGGEWPLVEFWSDQVAPLRKIINSFIEPLMDDALAKRNLELANEGADVKDGNESGNNLLRHLVKHTQDKNILKDELVNLLVAGRDTTMCLLTYSFYMLAEHPDIEKRLRQEIFDKVGPTGSPTYDQMREMKYMRAFLNEVLRLYPPVPVNGRVTNKPVVLPAANSSSKPIYIPAKTRCTYSVLIMHRRTDLWGPDALVFDPDRFLDDRVHKYITPNPFIFCPFNAGPRICLGQQFAYHEATYFLIRLLQQFTGFALDKSENLQPPADWAACDGMKGTEKVVPAAHLTLYVRGGLWVRMEPLKTMEE
ncbi:cytochrome P450 [Phlegmacium glaucopus]|nr:cytochrome P450 [Phlegmacium glaucopus]